MSGFVLFEQLTLAQQLAANDIALDTSRGFRTRRGIEFGVRRDGRLTGQYRRSGSAKRIIAEAFPEPPPSKTQLIGKFTALPKGAEFHLVKD